VARGEAAAHEGSEEEVSDNTERNYQQDANDAGPVSAAEATEIAQRFIDGHFNNVGKARPIISIPARPEYDSDIRMIAYIKQSDRDLAAAREELEKCKAEIASLSKTNAIISLSTPIEEELSDQIDTMLQDLHMEQYHTITIARLLIRVKKRLAADWSEIGSLRYKDKQSQTQLATANATVAQCKAAGFIDEQGNVRKVIGGDLVLTEDGAVVGKFPTIYELETRFGVTSVNEVQFASRDPSYGRYFSTRTAAEAAREGKGTT
jgi:hypothetical protein